MVWLLKLVEVIGTLIGIIWFFLYIIKHQSVVILYKDMNWRRLSHLGRHLGLKYFTKLFGQLALVDEMALMAGGGFIGRIASRYGTTAISSDIVAKTASTGWNMNLFVALLLLFFVVTEMYMAYRRDRWLFKDFKKLGTVALEIFVIFSFVELVTDFLV